MLDPIFLRGLNPTLPTVYDDGLSYYECIAKLQTKINECVAQINDLNLAGIKKALKEATDYVDSVAANVDEKLAYQLAEVNTAIKELNDYVQTEIGIANNYNIALVENALREITEIIREKSLEVTATNPLNGKQEGIDKCLGITDSLCRSTALCAKAYDSVGITCEEYDDYGANCYLFDIYGYNTIMEILIGDELLINENEGFNYIGSYLHNEMLYVYFELGLDLSSQLPEFVETFTIGSRLTNEIERRIVGGYVTDNSGDVSANNKLGAVSYRYRVSNNSITGLVPYGTLTDVVNNYTTFGSAAVIYCLPLKNLNFEAFKGGI